MWESRAARRFFYSLLPTPCSLFFSRTITPPRELQLDPQDEGKNPRCLENKSAKPKANESYAASSLPILPPSKSLLKTPARCTAFPPPASAPTPRSSLPISRSRARARESSPPRTVKVSAGQAPGSANSARPEPSVIAACSSSKPPRKNSPTSTTPAEPSSTKSTPPAPPSPKSGNGSKPTPHRPAPLHPPPPRSGQAHTIE